MNIEKLPSGKYRVRQNKDGKTYRLIFDYKPSKREAEDAIRDLIEQQSDKPNGDLTFHEASQKYAEMKRNVLSPSTIRDYVRYANRMPEWFTETRIDDITQISINKVVNELAVDKSPKTVRNFHGFISAVLGTFRPDFKIYTTLPQKRKSEPYIPSDDDVKRILAELNGTMFYIPIVLACYGMRRGEILALTADDLEGNTVHIRKAIVYDENCQRIEKTTKTTESERNIIIPKEIADQIRQQGYAYNGGPNSIVRKLEQTQDMLGIPRFSLHKLRHYFASKMLTLTDAKTVQALGGWKTDAVMKSVYAHSMKEEQEKAKLAAAEKLRQSIF